MPGRASGQSLAFDVRLPAVAGSASVDVVFNANRARELRLLRDTFSAKEVLGLAADPLPPLSFELPRPNVLRIPVRPGGAPVGGERVLVGCADEFPEIVQLVYRDDAGHVVARFTLPEDACASEGGAFVERAVPEAERTTLPFDAVAFVEQLERLLASAPDLPITRYRRFFAHLDRETNVSLLPCLVERLELGADEQGYRVGRIRLLMEVLTHRTSARARGALAPGAPLALADLVPAVRHVSALLLRIVDAHFGDDLAAFEEAFEMFADGDLRLQLPSKAWTSQPSSGFFFFFGELALLALDCDVDAARWTALGNVLIRSQRIFARRYAPDDAATATFSSYSSCNHDPLCAHAPSERARLRAAHAGFGPDELRRAATRNAQELLPGAA
jgi:hypothetical protein